MNSYVLTLGELGAGPTRSGQDQPPNPELGPRGLEMRLATRSCHCHTPRVCGLIFRTGRSDIVHHSKSNSCLAGCPLIVLKHWQASMTLALYPQGIRTSSVQGYSVTPNILTQINWVNWADINFRHWVLWTNIEIFPTVFMPNEDDGKDPTVC